MRISIKIEGGMRFTIPAPLWLVKTMLGFAPRIAVAHVKEEQRKYIENIDFKALANGFDELKHYKGLKMVEVKASDGTEVTIVI